MFRSRPAVMTSRTARAALVALILAGTAGCGTRLTRTEVLQANQVRFQPDPSGAGTAAPGPGSGAAADPAPGPGSGAAGDPAAGTALAGGSATGPSGPAGAAAGSDSSAGSASGARTGSAPGAATPGGAGGKAAPASGGGGAAKAPSGRGAPAPGATGGTPSGSGGAPAAGGGAANGPIVIGSVGTYSGPAGALDVPLVRAVQMWATKTNNGGGLAGRKISYIVVDDGGDPARHVAGLRDLAENKKVVAFVGIAAPFTAASGKAYVEQAKVPVIGGSCDTETYEQSTMYFVECTRFGDLITNIAKVGAQFGHKKKLAIIYCGEAEPCRKGDSLMTAGAAKAGLEIVYRAQTSLVQPDFTAECINAQRAGADALFPSTGPTATIRLAASCARQGYHPQFINGSNTSPELRTKSGLEDMLIAVPTFPFQGLDTPAAEEFAATFSQYGEGEPHPYHSQGWVTSKMFELAATRALQATGTISPKTLIDALYTFRNETFGGLSIPLTFTPGAGFTNPPCWWPMQASPDAWKPLNNGTMLC